MVRWTYACVVIPFAILACSDSASETSAPETDEEAPIVDPHGLWLAVPEAGELYHGVFPGDDPSAGEAEENAVSPATVDVYETAVGRKAAWIYFSHNWYQGRAFPLDTASWIRDRDSLPFVRLMLRSSSEQDIAEPTYTLEAIVDGEFDDDLEAWGLAAADFGTPLAVEFGTEVNGSWFSWNGAWNGSDESATQLFRYAYRHIVRVISAAGAENISWAFHVAAEDAPEEPWNRFENYYPGDDAVDWVGVSIYGTESPLDGDWTDFSSALDAVTQRFSALAADKPLMVMEFGASDGSPGGDVPSWADAALSDLLGGTWPAVRGFAWWNETWQNDDDPTHDTDMRVETVPGLAAVFQDHLSDAAVIDTPIDAP